MRRPSIAALAPNLLGVARTAADAIRQAGGRAWIVGGAVRDLALGLEPHDLDLASRLHPEELEGRFATVAPVGRAFGSLVLVVDGTALQHTTFRSERGYSDARRPDRVRFGATLEEDAGRRDFTCNALYLDPLDDELCDPQGGLADLGAGLLRCVGDPAARFAEDGLRILRLARFAAGYALAIEESTARAVPSAVSALRGVSEERVAGELARLGERPGSARAVEILERLEVLGSLLERFGLALPLDERRRRIAVLRGLAEPVSFVELCAVLFTSGEAQLARALERLRLSRETQREVLALARDVRSALELARAPRDGSRAARIRLVREPRWPSVLRVALARSPAGAPERDGLCALEAFAAGLSAQEERPAPLIESDDLGASGLAPGPRWGELLREAEEAQLDGRIATRAQALAWLAERLRGG